MNSLRRGILFPFLVVAFVSGGAWQPAAATTPDSLFSFGHAFVEIKTAEGKIIYIDPFAANAFRDSADIVLITHEHTDHTELSRVHLKADAQVIRSADAIRNGAYQSVVIGDVEVMAVAAYNSNHVKSQCVGYVVTFDGIKLYHAGDTGNITEMSDLASQGIAYALLPMDGVYTMTPEEATTAAGVINARHDIPIHTMPPPDTYSDAIVARFTSPNRLIVRPGEGIELAPTVTDAGSGPAAPRKFGLAQNFPNPFNPSTTIRYELADAGFVNLRVYDILGKLVAELVSTVEKEGFHSVSWNATGIASGVYLYRLTVRVEGGKTSVQTRKMVLAR